MFDIWHHIIIEHNGAASVAFLALQNEMAKNWLMPYADAQLVANDFSGKKIPQPKPCRLNNLLIHGAKCTVVTLEPTLQQCCKCESRTAERHNEIWWPDTVEAITTLPRLEYLRGWGYSIVDGHFASRIHISMGGAACSLPNEIVRGDSRRLGKSQEDHSILTKLFIYTKIAREWKV